MVNVRPIDPALQKKAIDELFEDPARIEKDLETFKEWIKKSQHLNARIDDQFLIAFLRGCKYSMEKVKQKFDLHFTLKTHTPELTRNRDPMDPKNLSAIKKGVGVPLPKLESPDSPRYFLIRPGAYDPSVNSVQDIMKVAAMISEMMMMEDDNFVIAGQIGILDFSGVSMSHFVQFNPMFIKKVTMLQQDATPVRVKGQHFVNMPTIALTVFNIFQSFSNEKNKKRVRIYDFFNFHFYQQYFSRFMFMVMIWKHFTKLFQETFYQRNMVVKLVRFKTLSMTWRSVWSLFVIILSMTKSLV